MNDDFLSNTYVVADEPGGHAVMIDAGGPVEPLLDFLRRGQLSLTHVLLTHRHHDHVSQVDRVLRALSRDPRADPRARALERPGRHRHDVPGRDDRERGADIEPIHTPGHTAGMLSLLVGGTDVFTGDTLFKGSVGGVHAPGSTGYADIKSSIMDKLLKLPPETHIHPGHTDPTTVADELERNGFVRIWRGLDPEGNEPCTALGEPATLILFGDDYDGGHKAWVRWPDGSDDIVPGSRVQRSR